MLSPRARTTIAWGCALVLGAVFLVQGGTKLFGAQFERDAFARWHYAAWFMYVAGAIEVLGAVVVLVPQTRPKGAVLLTAMMLGAMGTHLYWKEFLSVFLPLALLVIAVTIIVLERNRFLKRVISAS